MQLILGFVSRYTCRFSAVIKDNVITHFNLDDGLTCSLAEPTLAQLKEA